MILLYPIGILRRGKTILLGHWRIEWVYIFQCIFWTTGLRSNEAFVGPETVYDTAAIILKAMGTNESRYLYLGMLHDSLAANI